MNFVVLKSKSALALMAGAFFVISINVYAQAPVVSRNAVPEEAPTNSSLEMLLELQALRQEISSLTGTIESLEYKVAKLERQQVENYKDLDGRLSALYQGGTVPQTNPPDIAVQNTQSSSTSSSSNNSASSSNTIDGGITPLSDFDVSSSGASAQSKLIYERGFAALRNGERDNAISAFQSVVEDYPDSKEMADSLYWLGQTYWLANKREESRQSFVRLLDSFPDYRKTGDAMYRLGIIYDQLGDNDQAYDYMSQVLLSGSSQVEAAQAWISENASPASN